MEIIKCTALDKGWEFAEIQPDKQYTRFRKFEDIFDVWHTLTVRIIKNNKTSYYRDNTEEDVCKLL